MSFYRHSSVSSSLCSCSYSAHEEPFALRHVGVHPRCGVGDSGYARRRMDEEIVLVQAQLCNQSPKTRTARSSGPAAPKLLNLSPQLGSLSPASPNPLSSSSPPVYRTTMIGWSSMDATRIALRSRRSLVHVHHVPVLSHGNNNRVALLPAGQIGRGRNVQLAAIPFAGH